MTKGKEGRRGEEGEGKRQVRGYEPTRGGRIINKYIAAINEEKGIKENENTRHGTACVSSFCFFIYFHFTDVAWLSVRLRFSIARLLDFAGVIVYTWQALRKGKADCKAQGEARRGPIQAQGRAKRNFRPYSRNLGNPGIPTQFELGTPFGKVGWFVVLVRIVIIIRSFTLTLSQSTVLRFLPLFFLILSHLFSLISLYPSTI